MITRAEREAGTNGEVRCRTAHVYAGSTERERVAGRDVHRAAGIGHEDASPARARSEGDGICCRDHAVPNRHVARARRVAADPACALIEARRVVCFLNLCWRNRWRRRQNRSIRHDWHSGGEQANDGYIKRSVRIVSSAPPQHARLTAKPARNVRAAIVHSRICGDRRPSESKPAVGRDTFVYFVMRTERHARCGGQIKRIRRIAGNINGVYILRIKSHAAAVIGLAVVKRTPRLRDKTLLPVSPCPASVVIIDSRIRPGRTGHRIHFGLEHAHWCGIGLISKFPAPGARVGNPLVRIHRRGGVVLIDDRTALAGVMQNRQLRKIRHERAVGLIKCPALIIHLVKRGRLRVGMRVGVKHINAIGVIGTVFDVRPS